jgi:hypothetical protein
LPGSRTHLALQDTEALGVVVGAYSDDPARVFQPSSAHRSNLMAPTIPI